MQTANPVSMSLLRSFAVVLILQCSCLVVYSQSTTASDESAARSLKERFASIAGLSDVTVAVEGGVVTLSGPVSESGLRVTAAEIAAAQDGVIEVQNKLVLGGELSERVGSALDRVSLKLRMLLGYLPIALLAIVLLLCFVLLARLVSRPGIVAKLVGNNRFLQEVISQGIKIVVVLIGLVVALDLLDAGRLVAAIFGAAGVAGLAIGFAFKDLIENYVSSLLLSLRRPFQLGDFVNVGDYEGKVISLNTRSTILMTLDGNHLRLPNSYVFKSVMINYTKNVERRFDFVVGVGVEEDLIAAQRIGVDTLIASDGVLESPPPWAAISGLGDSNVEIQFFAWVNQRTHSFAKVKGESIRRVKLALQAAGMDLPEPIQRIRLERNQSSNTEKAAPRPPRAKGHDDASVDVSPDHSIDQQVAEEIEEIRDRNLLLQGTDEE